MSQRHRLATSAATARFRTSYKYFRRGHAARIPDTHSETPAAVKSKASAWFAAGASYRRSPLRRIAPRTPAVPPRCTTGIEDRATIAANVSSSFWMVIQGGADIRASELSLSGAHERRSRSARVEVQRPFLSYPVPGILMPYCSFCGTEL